MCAGIRRSWTYFAQVWYGFVLLVRAHARTHLEHADPNAGMKTNSRTDEKLAYAIFYWKKNANSQRAPLAFGAGIASVSRRPFFPSAGLVARLLANGGCPSFAPYGVPSTISFFFRATGSLGFLGDREFPSR
jgi:hypothetical protein